MQYHRGPSTHSLAQNNPALGLEMLGLTAYTCADPGTEVAQTYANLYGVDVAAQHSRGPYRTEESSECSRDRSRVLEATRHDVTLYAPVPSLPSLLFSASFNYNHAEYQHPQLATPQQPGYLPFQGIEVQNAAAPSQHINCEASDTAYYSNDAPMQTFPTPSELLLELAGNNPPANPTQYGYDRNVNDLSKRPRRRPINRGLSLIPGDSEPISSHEKKRHYLECLEQYTMYLHQQLSLVGVEPVPLERVSQYNGLNNRSIRTLLVHMENTTKKLNLRTLTEEQRFVDLRDALYRQDNHTNTVE